MATAIIAGLATAGGAVVAAGGFAAFAAAGSSLWMAFAVGAGFYSGLCLAREPRGAAHVSCLNGHAVCFGARATLVCARWPGSRGGASVGHTSWYHCFTIVIPSTTR